MSKFTEDFAAYVRRNGWNILRVAEAKEGAISVSDLVPCNACQDSYSVAKVFVTVAVGKLSDGGILSLEEKIADILGEECQKIHPAYTALTVEDALKHRMGLPGGFLDIDAGDARAFGSDYLQYTLSTPPLYTPGRDSVYTDAAFYLLARVVEKKTGEGLDCFLWRELMFPLSFREVAWSKCPKGHTLGATGLYIGTEDMVKIGELYRNLGVYEGKRYLSEAWMKTVYEKGFEWHEKCEGKGYGKGGMRGQMLMTLPGQNRSVAWHGYETKSTAELVEWVCNYED